VEIVCSLFPFEFKALSNYRLRLDYQKKDYLFRMTGHWTEVQQLIATERGTQAKAAGEWVEAPAMSLTWGH
jgi:hypothetical protein